MGGAGMGGGHGEYLEMWGDRQVRSADEERDQDDDRDGNAEEQE
jgi:hypothetical protein